MWEAFSAILRGRWMLAWRPLRKPLPRDDAHIGRVFHTWNSWAWVSSRFGPTDGTSCVRGAAEAWLIRRKVRSAR
jgi:hypothetical protein